MILAFLNFKAIIIESVVSPAAPNKNSAVITYPLTPVFGAERCFAPLLFLAFLSAFGVAALLAGAGVFWGAFGAAGAFVFAPVFVELLFVPVFELFIGAGVTGVGVSVNGFY